MVKGKIKEAETANIGTWGGGMKTGTEVWSEEGRGRDRRVEKPNIGIRRIFKSQGRPKWRETETQRTDKLRGKSRSSGVEGDEGRAQKNKDGWKRRT